MLVSTKCVNHSLTGRKIKRGEWEIRMTYSYLFLIWQRRENLWIVFVCATTISWVSWPSNLLISSIGKVKNYHVIVSSQGRRTLHIRLEGLDKNLSSTTIKSKYPIANVQNLFVIYFKAKKIDCYFQSITFGRASTCNHTYLLVKTARTFQFVVSFKTFVYFQLGWLRNLIIGVVFRLVNQFIFKLVNCHNWSFS